MVFCVAGAFAGSRDIHNSNGNSAPSKVLPAEDFHPTLEVADARSQLGVSEKTLGVGGDPEIWHEAEGRKNGFTRSKSCPSYGAEDKEDSVNHNMSPNSEANGQRLSQSEAMLTSVDSSTQSDVTLVTDTLVVDSQGKPSPLSPKRPDKPKAPVRTVSIPQGQGRLASFKPQDNSKTAADVNRPRLNKVSSVRDKV